MDRQEAEKILSGTIQPDNSLYNLGHYICWDIGDEEVTLDCRFSADELEAIVWWMRNSVITSD